MHRMLPDTPGYKCAQETPNCWQADLVSDFGFLPPLNIISPKKTYLHLSITVIWKSVSFSLKEKLRVFFATLLFLNSPLKPEFRRTQLVGAGDLVNHSPRASPLAKKVTFLQLTSALDSVALALVDAQLYFALKQHYHENKRTQNKE